MDLSQRLRMALLLAGATAAFPAAADHLDPRVLGPLQALAQQAAMQCQAGNQQGCANMQQLRQAEMQLSQAQHACQAGNQQACAYFQNGAQQIGAAYQQMQMQSQAPAGGGYAPGGGQGYSTQQMTRDHQQRMQQQQMQFQQQQQQYQRQQQLNDQQHQRFMEQLRR
ncbi:MAG TPA: hypothetical protein VGN83_12335 [Falsiroseomonas sp.]|jgi:cell division protein FtsN|nr:hypothetical protein [Falsiroseomonas sp.]